MTTQMTDPPQTLQTLEAALEHADEDEKLALVDEYLAQNPDDTGALVLKAELLVRHEDYSDAGKLIAELTPRLSGTPRFDKLLARVDDIVREKLRSSRENSSMFYSFGRMGYPSLDAAVALAYNDPSIAMAAGLIILREAADLNAATFCSPGDSGARLLPASRYFDMAMKRATPDSDLARRAAFHRLRIMLAQDDGKAALDLLQTMPGVLDVLGDCTGAFCACVARLAVKRAGLLLEIGEAEAAVEVLDLCDPLAPDLPEAHLMRAEIARLNDQPADACRHYEAALAATGVPDGGQPALAVPLLTRLAELTVVCADCGKRTRADSESCAYCARRLAARPLWMHRFHLRNQPVGAVARIGLGLLRTEAGENGAGLDVFLDGLGELDGDADNALAPLREEWIRASRKHARQEPTPPPLRTLVERWQRDGLTADVVEALRAGAEIDWAALSERKRCTLIRSTFALNDHALTRQLWNTAFATPPQTKTGKALEQTLLSRDATEADALLVAAWSAHAGGDDARALDSVTAALALVPQHAEARLLRGKLRSRERAYVAALADLEFAIATGGPSAAAARFEAALVLEQLGDMSRALELLEDAPPDEATETLRARLVRRRQGAPYVRVSQSDGVVMHDTLGRSAGSTYEGVFAIALRLAGRPTSGAAEAWFHHLMTAHYEFVQAIGALRDSAGDPVFALRWISRPHPMIPERGELTFAILVRVSAANAALCHAHALELWSALRPMLPGAQAHMYSFEPVMDEAELAGLLTPFEPVALAEIVRREETPKSNSSRYTVYPFMAGSPNLHTLCWALLRQPGPAMLSLHLVPTSLQPWEEARFERIMREPVDDERLDPDHAQVTYADPVSRWWQGAPQWGQAQASRYLVDFLRAQAYVLRVNVATGPQTPLALPEILASTLFGTVRPVNNALFGGYEVVRATTDAERAIARRNLEAVDVEGWVYSAAPAGASRLRHLVSESEAVLAFRLPIPGAEGIPGVAIMDVKPVVPPPELPMSGTLLGESVARVGGVPLPVYQADDDRRRHTYIVGKTGVGKSTMLKNLALRDIDAGHGVCVIDPHGDLIDELLTLIPERRVEDVVVFDPSDHERPVGLNLLEARSDAERYQIVNEFIGLLVRMYDPHQQGIVGPRFQHNVRNAMLTVMSVEGNTLIEVVRVLTDSSYIKQLLPHVTDPLVKNYWTKQIANTSDYHKSEILDYIVSKFSRFVGDALVRNIVGQSHTTLDFRAIMDERKILLVKLSKGRIGPENAQFLGLLLVQRLLLTALGRADALPENRPDFFLYVDEFQNFATELFATVLSEGRKYGVAATVANQYLTQLDKTIIEAISGNVGSLICFRVGTQDAAALATELYPVFGQDDLLNLPKYTACVKLLADGLAARPFTMRTRLDARTPNYERAAAVRARSREVYGRDVREVDGQVIARFAPKG